MRRRLEKAPRVSPWTVYTPCMIGLVDWTPLFGEGYSLPLRQLIFPHRTIQENEEITARFVYV